MTADSIGPDRDEPSLENVELFPTMRGWDPAVVPMPRRRKLAKPSPFFAWEKEHGKLYAKMRPLQQAAWELRHLPENHHRRRKVEAAQNDLWPKIHQLETEMIRWATENRANPGVLIAQINLFRDWIDYRREPMVDAVIAGLRMLLAEQQPHY